MLFSFIYKYKCNNIDTSKISTCIIDETGPYVDPIKCIINCNFERGMNSTNSNDKLLNNLNINGPGMPINICFHKTNCKNNGCCVENTTTQDVNIEIINKISDYEFPLLYKLYHSKNKPVGVLYYIHGGGWVNGKGDILYSIFSKIVIETNYIIYSISYSLSPIVRFPNALYECLSGWKYICDNHKNITKIITGDSAGGNLTLGLILKLIDIKYELPKVQILFSPPLDSSCTSSSYLNPIQDSGLDNDMMSLCWGAYLGNNLLDIKNPYYSPIYATDKQISELPQTIIIEGDLDILTEEGILFYNRISLKSKEHKLIILENTKHDPMFIQDGTDPFNPINQRINPELIKYMKINYNNSKFNYITLIIIIISILVFLIIIFYKLYHVKKSYNKNSVYDYAF